MTVISRSKGSMFGDKNTEISEQFSGYFKKPETLQKMLKKRVEDLKPLANLVRDIVEMPGWKQIIGPFLEAECNQINQFKTFKSEVSENVKYMALGKSEAFFQFLMLVKNLVAIAEIDTSDKKERKGDAIP